MTSITLEEYPTVSLGKRERRENTFTKKKIFYWLLYKPALTLGQCLKGGNKTPLWKFTEEEGESSEQLHFSIQQIREEVILFDLRIFIFNFFFSLQNI